MDARNRLSEFLTHDTSAFAAAYTTGEVPPSTFVAVPVT
jgi:hypothetical protein